MANPVPYQQLFDIDGLNAAIRECEGTADEFSAAVTEDFKRINASVQAIKKSIEALNASMGQRTIKLVDETSQQAIVDYAKQVVDLTKQVRDQQTAITNLNEVINANKVAVSDAKVAAEQYKVEQQNLKAQQEATKLAIVQETLSLEQQKQALTDSKLAAQQAITVQQNNKSAISASNLANQQYITTVKEQRAAQATLNTQIAQNRLAMSNLALANKQAAQAQTAATGSYNEAAARLKALGNEIKSAKDGFTSTDPVIKAQIKSYNDLNDKLKAFDASMGNHQRNVGNYKSVIGNLQGELSAYAANLFTIAAAMEAVNKAFDLALSTDATRTSLGYILGNTELADIKLRTLKETANRLGIEFVSTAKAYALFTGAAKASNFSLDEADKIFNSVARASGILHLSAEQTSNAFYALQEMISKGTIQSKELQRQLGQAIPGAVQIMADAIGVSVQKLHDMEKAGELLTADILPKFAAQLDKTFAPGVNKVDSLQASVNNLKNTFSEMVDENTAINQFFKNIVTNVNNIASSIAKTINSTSWQEFWLRFKPAIGQASIDKNLSAADLAHNLQNARDQSFGAFMAGVANDANLFFKANAPIDDVKKRVNQLQIALIDAGTAYDGLSKAVKSGQLHEGGDLVLNNLKATYGAIKANLELYEQKYPDVFKKAEKAQVELTDAQLTSVEQIRKRITELSKLPGSATPGSDIANRIEDLKRRLHDLAPSYKAAKDGFQVLEEQIKKTMLALQDSIIQDYAKHQGKETENTKKLASAYQDLTEKLIALQKLRDDAITKVRQQRQIAALGSLFPLNTKPDALPNTSLTNDPRDRNSLGNALQIGQDNIDIGEIDKKLDEVATSYSILSRKIIESYKARNLTKAQMDAQLLEIERVQSENEYNLNSARLTKELEIAKLTYGENSKQYNALLLKKAKLDEQYSKQGIKNLEDTEAAKRKIIEETITILQKSSSVLSSVTGNAGLGNLFSDFSKDAVQGIGKAEQFQATAQIAIDATSAYTDFAINASKARQAALETEMQYEIDGAGTNADAKKKIEAEYTKKVNAEKAKQAKAAKAAAEIEIVINTAVAASKVFGQTGIFGIGLAPIIIGLGLAELAIVAATNIPQFEKGRTSGPATIALVNERGPELLVKDGKGRFANKGKKGYTFLRENEQVFRADETAKYVSSQLDNSVQVSKSKPIYDTWVSSQTGSRDIDYDRLGRSVGDAVGKLPLQENNWNDKGYQRYTRTSNSRIKSVRDRNKL